MKPTGLCLFVVAMFLAAPLLAEEVDPQAILDKTIETYKSLNTYESSGEVSMNMETEQGNTDLDTEFSIRLKKPDLFLIQWEQHQGILDNGFAGAVWNDGDGPRLFMGITNSYSKLPNNMIALSAATGISGGAAHTIPFLFLPKEEEMDSPLARLKDLKMRDEEEVEGDLCYVIEAQSLVSREEVIWISKDRHLIKKWSRSLEPPAGGVDFPAPSDEELAESLKPLGQEVTKETKAALREQLDEAREFTKSIRLKGTMVEHYREMKSPQLEPEDFKFELPAGAKEDKSLFGGLLQAN